MRDRRRARAVRRCRAAVRRARGKFAARHCVAHLVPRVTEAFFKQKACRAYRYDTRVVGESDARRVPPRVRRRRGHRVRAAGRGDQAPGSLGHDRGGAFFKKSDDGDVHVKCARVGTRAVVLTRDFDPSRTMDLSDDHKPGSASEVARIREHYETLHGGAVFKSRDEVLAHFEASAARRQKRRGQGKKPLPPGFGKIGNHSNGSSPGLVPGNSGRNRAETRSGVALRTPGGVRGTARTSPRATGCPRWR